MVHYVTEEVKPGFRIGRLSEDEKTALIEDKLNKLSEKELKKLTEDEKKELSEEQLKELVDDKRKKIIESKLKKISEGELKKLIAKKMLTLLIFVPNKHTIHSLGLNKNELKTSICVEQGPQSEIFKNFLEKKVMYNTRLLNKFKKNIYIYHYKLNDVYSKSAKEKCISDLKVSDVYNSEKEIPNLKCVVISNIDLSKQDIQKYYINSLPGHFGLEELYDKAATFDHLLQATTKHIKYGDYMARDLGLEELNRPLEYEQSGKSKKPLIRIISTKPIKYGDKEPVKLKEDKPSEDGLKEFVLGDTKTFKLQKEMQEDLTEIINDLRNKYDIGCDDAVISSGYRSESEHVYMRRIKFYEQLREAVKAKLIEQHKKDPKYRDPAEQLFQILSNMESTDIKTDNKNNMSIKRIRRTKTEYDYMIEISKNVFDRYPVSLLKNKEQFIEQYCGYKVDRELNLELENDPEKDIKKLFQKYYNENKNKTEIKELVSKLEKTVNETLPYKGKSDHHTGLAVDFGLIGPNHPAYPWLLEHAHEYGFVQRYTKASSKDTGVGEESWHWRYVGKKHAKKIHDYGVTLDDYIKKELYKEK